MGEPLAKLLVERGYNLKGTTRSPEKKRRLEVANIETFLLDFDQEIIALDAIFGLFQADVFFINLPPGRGKEGIAEKYPQQIEFLLENIVQESTAPREQKPWVVFASSSGVYGSQNCLLTESTPCQPTRSGAKAIYAAEKLLANYAEKIDFTILRFAGLVGGNRQPGRFSAGKKELNSGQTPVNLVHLEDCIGVVSLLIEKELRYPLFNVCADEHPLHSQFYPAQALKLGLEAPTYSDVVEMPKRILDNRLLKEKTGYRFQHPDPMLF
jgi:nucleoside-diphosphate-sugar epimerase